MNLYRLPEKYLIAHRGYSAAFPENTKASFQGAIDHGALMMEFDVCLSLDRKPVVIHDERLERTTSGTGYVKDRTLAEIKKLDAGSWFSDRFKGLEVPDLDEVLSLFGKKILLNIEIKVSAVDVQQKKDSIELQVIEKIKRYALKSRVIISSFDHGLLKRVSKLEEGVALGLLSEEKSFDRLNETLKSLNCYSWNTDEKSLDSHSAGLARKEGLKVMAYTVNRQDRLDELFEMGVNGVFTDELTLNVR